MSIGAATHRAIHNKLVFSRRAEKLTQALDSVLPGDARVLDVGCGNGLISHKLQTLNPSRCFTGIDVVARDTCLIPCQMYDGEHFPFDSGSFDYAMFVDVLHHTEDPAKLLTEAARVTKAGVVIKDHYCESKLDQQTLSLMDWFGNAQYGIALPYNYKSRREWETLFTGAGLEEARTSTDIGLYPFPANLIFGRGLHFVSLLKKTTGLSGSKSGPASATSNRPPSTGSLAQ